MQNPRGCQYAITLYLAMHLSNLVKIEEKRRIVRWVLAQPAPQSCVVRRQHQQQRRLVPRPSMLFAGIRRHVGDSGG